MSWTMFFVAFIMWLIVNMVLLWVMYEPHWKDIKDGWDSIEWGDG